jgi:ferritin
MSELDEILNKLGTSNVPSGGGYTDLKEVDPASVQHVKQEIKDLIQELVDETFEPNDAKAFEFWQKVEAL